MKFTQEFEISEDIQSVWRFFERPEIVAECMPGMESIQVINPETFVVQVTQKVGLISATFESRVIITEKVENERIAFSATGKTVRGAIGNFRAESIVTLHPRERGTLVRVESDAALAGVLGSVGQKIVAKQAEKITEQFAANLEARISGTSVPAAEPAPALASAAAQRDVKPQLANPPMQPGPFYQPAPQGDGWGKAAMALGLVNVMIGLAILVSLN